MPERRDGTRVIHEQHEQEDAEPLPHRRLQQGMAKPARGVNSAPASPPSEKTHALRLLTPPFVRSENGIQQSRDAPASAQQCRHTP